MSCIPAISFKNLLSTLESLKTWLSAAHPFVHSPQCTVWKFRQGDGNRNFADSNVHVFCFVEPSISDVGNSSDTPNYFLMFILRFRQFHDVFFSRIETVTKFWIRYSINLIYWWTPPPSPINVVYVSFHLWAGPRQNMCWKVLSKMGIGTLRQCSTIWKVFLFLEGSSASFWQFSTWNQKVKNSF